MFIDGTLQGNGVVPIFNTNENSIFQIAKYFHSGDQPIRREELLEFWSSLSDSEKEYYRKVDLETGLPRAV